MAIRTVSLLLLLTIGQVSAFGQTCTVIDSINTNTANGYNDYFHPVGISYDGSGFWVAGSTLGVDRFYKIDYSGARVDSVSYESYGAPMETILYDNGYLWGVRYMVDTLFKIDIASETIVASYALGFDPNPEEIVDMTLLGDTIYFITGGSADLGMKFCKSSGTFTTLPSGSYSPTGFEFWNGVLYATSWFPAWMHACRYNPNDLMPDAATASSTWCVDQSMALTTDSSYFYQTSWNSTYIYVLSNDQLGVDNLTNQETVEISPNPSNGQISISNAPLHANVTVSDLIGNVVMSKEITSGKEALSIQGSPGVYIVEITDRDHKDVYRIVLE